MMIKEPKLTIEFESFIMSEYYCLTIVSRSKNDLTPGFE